MSYNRRNEMNSAAAATAVIVGMIFHVLGLALVGLASYAGRGYCARRDARRAARRAAE